MNRAVFIIFLILGASYAHAFNTYYTPTRLNPLEMVRLYTTYDCPYPSGDYSVENVGNYTLELKIATNSNICFDGEYPEIEAQFDLGILPAGTYDLKYAYILSENAPIQWRTTHFTVEDRIPEALTGLWNNPLQPGHGISLYSTDNDQIIIYWMTYDRQGNQIWLFGATDNNSTQLDFDMFVTQGMLFGDFDPDTIDLEPWGTIHIDFSDCTHAEMNWSADQPFGSGSMDLELALPSANYQCDRNQ
ncbi:MAG: hypothetical protein ACWA5R_12375 [bacterium]